MSELTLDLDSILKVGQSAKLHLRVGAEDRVLNSRILKLLPDGIVVVWPNDRDTRVPVDVGQRVVLEVKCSRGLLQLDSTIIANSTEPIQLLRISRAGKWSRSQLRLNVRLDVAIVDSEAFLVSKDLNEDDGGGAGRWAIIDALKKGRAQGEPIGAIIRDISAGGMRLATAECLEPGAFIRIEFPLGKEQWDIAAMARVIWAREGESPRRKYPYEAGCQFLDLGIREQDNIAKFIFLRQAELRRWGLI